MAKCESGIKTFPNIKEPRNVTHISKGSCWKKNFNENEKLA